MSEKPNPIKKTEPKYIIDPSDVTKKDDLRVRQWGLSIMKKYESKLNHLLPNGRIVYWKEVEPEEIDIRNIYPFPDLFWFIHKQDKMWCLTLCYRHPRYKNDIILARMYYVRL